MIRATFTGGPTCRNHWFRNSGSVDSSYRIIRPQTSGICTKDKSRKIKILFQHNHLKLKQFQCNQFFQIERKPPNTFFANVVPASSKLQLIHYSFLARQHVKRKMQMETVKDTVTLSPLQQTSQFAKTIINKSFKVAKTSVVIF